MGYHKLIICSGCKLPAYSIGNNLPTSSCNDGSSEARALTHPRSTTCPATGRKSEGYRLLSERSLVRIQPVVAPCRGVRTVDNTCLQGPIVDSYQVKAYLVMVQIHPPALSRDGEIVDVAGGVRESCSHYTIPAAAEIICVSVRIRFPRPVCTLSARWKFQLI